MVNQQKKRRRSKKENASMKEKREQKGGVWVNLDRKPEGAEGGRWVQAPMGQRSPGGTRVGAEQGGRVAPQSCWLFKKSRVLNLSLCCL